MEIINICDYICDDIIEKIIEYMEPVDSIIFLENIYKLSDNRYNKIYKNFSPHPIALLSEQLNYEIFIRMLFKKIFKKGCFFIKFRSH